MDVVLEVGVEDFIIEEDGYEIIIILEDFFSVCDELKVKGYEFIFVDVKMIF